jgi:hypothetical protein
MWLEFVAISVLITLALFPFGGNDRLLASLGLPWSERRVERSSHTLDIKRPDTS